jgi:hypothetical protein
LDIRLFVQQPPFRCRCALVVGGAATPSHERRPCDVSLHAACPRRGTIWHLFQTTVGTSRRGASKAASAAREPTARPPRAVWPGAFDFDIRASHSCPDCDRRFPRAHRSPRQNRAMPPRRDAGETIGQLRQRRRAEGVKCGTSPLCSIDALSLAPSRASHRRRCRRYLPCRRRRGVLASLVDTC